MDFVGEHSAHLLNVAVAGFSVPSNEVRVLFRRSLTLAVFAAALPHAAWCAQRSTRVSPADILIVHAKIYTVDEKKPWAQSLAIHKGRIVAVGSDEQVRRFRGIGTKMIDAGGKLVLPAFTDTHIHMADDGFSLARVNLQGAKDVVEIQNRLRVYASQHPDEKWILGQGWNYAMFAPETLPNKKALDQLFPAIPVFLECYDRHTFWANAKALSLAGIGQSTANPPNGEIVRDPRTGEPTGALKESAGDLVAHILPRPTYVEYLNAFRAAIKWANQNGIARVHSAGGDFEHLDVLEELRDEKQLSVRFHIAYKVEPPELHPQDLDAIESARKRFHDDWIDVNSVNFFLDGVVESHTAALLDPYTDMPATKGVLFWDPDKYQSAVRELDKRGLQLYSHAIGDSAVRTALDAYESAEQRNHSKDHRNRIEHIQTISAQDLPRFARLNIIASMQPQRAYPDEDTRDVWARAIGPERASRAWVWKSIAQYGAHYAFGSDWPVVTLNPWEGIQTAVTRQTVDGQPAGGFVPSQKLTVAQAIEGYTIEAAYSGHREKTEGSIEAGKVADVIIVDRNVFEIATHTIHQTKVVFTIVGGKIVYETDQE